jgi:hypothetical protein
MAAEQAKLVGLLGVSVPSAVVEVVGEGEIANWISEFSLANNEVIARLEAWRQSLSEAQRQLHSAQTNVGRLSKAYRQ